MVVGHVTDARFWYTGTSPPAASPPSLMWRVYIGALIDVASGGASY
jgi:hypothetical protein